MDEQTTTEQSGGQSQRRWSRAEARGLLAEWAASGQSQRRWCERHGLSVATLGYWLRRKQAVPPTGLSLVPITVRNGAAREASVDAVAMNEGA